MGFVPKVALVTEFLSAFADIQERSRIRLKSLSVSLDLHTPRNLQVDK